MLDPNDRLLYMDALRPPAGYSLDAGVATTFSLDLLTLLIIPLSFVMFDRDGIEGDLKDPVKILEALRRTSDKFTICCQKGRISIPAGSNLLYSYLEDSVVEISPSKGVFHPKVWVLRYTADNQTPVYRLLCLSRNLTFDKSWDTLLTLEGYVGSEICHDNQHLLDFISSLPEVNKDNLATIVKELPFIQFTPPPGYSTGIRFWPLGIEGHINTPVFVEADRMLIVSPFLTENFLRRLTQGRDTEFYLISRQNSLDSIDPTVLTVFKEIYILDDPSAEETIDQDIQNSADLHAKLFIAERGDSVRLWTGSANATDAAFSANVEFMTELSGHKKNIGIDTFLDPDKNPFRAMLLRYKIPTERCQTDTVKSELEDQIETIRRKIVSAGLELQVFPSDGENEYKLVLHHHHGDLDTEAVEAKCWPISIKEHNAVDLKVLKIDGELYFPTISVESITSFIAFEITARDGKHKHTARFVMNLPLQGMPENRNERILYSMISDRGRFLRYLLFLLAEDQGVSVDGTILAHLTGSWGTTNGAGLPGIPLMEQMVRALCRNPEKLDAIARLVSVCKTNEEKQVFPPGFEQLWEPVWEARKRMVRNK